MKKRRSNTMPKYVLEAIASFPIRIELEADNKKDAVDYAYTALNDCTLMPTLFLEREEVDYEGDGSVFVEIEDSDWQFKVFSPVVE
jgi:hypothetical protein